MLEETGAVVKVSQGMIGVEGEGRILEGDEAADGRPGVSPIFGERAESARQRARQTLPCRPASAKLTGEAVSAWSLANVVKRAFRHFRTS
jgi:hypothetical protein